jgi:hypothetical protein
MLNATDFQADGLFDEVTGSFRFERDRFDLDPDEVQPVFVPIERSICA